MLSGGVRNLFNKQPPLIESEVGAGTDPATYDTRGRYYFIRIKKTFWFLWLDQNSPKKENFRSFLGPFRLCLSSLENQEI